MKDASLLEAFFLQSKMRIRARKLGGKTSFIFMYLKVHVKAVSAA